MAFGQPRHRARAWGLVAVDFVLCLGKPLSIPQPNSKKQDGMLPFFVLGRLVAVNVFLYSASETPSFEE